MACYIGVSGDPTRYALDMDHIPVTPERRSSYGRCPGSIRRPVAFAGARHPQLLGSKVREGWPEVADFNDNVMKVGLAGGTLA
jgi:hypothetical protein